MSSQRGQMKNLCDGAAPYQCDDRGSIVFAQIRFQPSSCSSAFAVFQERAPQFVVEPIVNVLVQRLGDCNLFAHGFTFLFTELFTALEKKTTWIP
jgi:hypothetical protein